MTDPSVFKFFLGLLNNDDKEDETVKIVMISPSPDIGFVYFSNVSSEATASELFFVYFLLFFLRLSFCPAHFVPYEAILITNINVMYLPQHTSETRELHYHYQGTGGGNTFKKMFIVHLI